MTYKLLITGSRKASKPMLELARRTVLRAKELGWSIIVGDAFGVDQQVVFACIRHNVGFECYGITDKARNFQDNYYMIVHWETIATYTKVDGDYLARDRHMVSLCDRCFAIWNGESRGTKYTYDYARNFPKPADIRSFKLDQVNSCQ